MRHSGPSDRPCRGVSIREVHGVWMRPINTKPASVAGGIATATSALRISFSRTTSHSAFVASTGEQAWAKPLAGHVLSAHDLELDIDIAARRVRVRTDLLMRLPRQCCKLRLR